MAPSRPKHDHIPRAKNCFILFRMDRAARAEAGARYPDEPEIVALGKLWSELPEHEKVTWRHWATLEKTRHAAEYPGYRYQPKQKKKKPKALEKEETKKPRLEMTSTPDQPISTLPAPGWNIRKSGTGVLDLPSAKNTDGALCDAPLPLSLGPEPPAEHSDFDCLRVRNLSRTFFFFLLSH